MKSRAGRDKTFPAIGLYKLFNLQVRKYGHLKCDYQKEEPMASERLSKFQEFVLSQLIERHIVGNQGQLGKAFYGKKRSEPLTNAERATLSKSYKNMMEKGLLVNVGADHPRTVMSEKGFNTLKANKSVIADQYVSFNEYQDIVNESIERRSQWLK